MPVADWAKDLVADVVGKAPFKIGDIVKHPSGRTVKIIEGQYWGERGLSNFWYWKEVHPNGILGPVEHGYGWCLEEPKIRSTK